MGMQARTIRFPEEVSRKGAERARREGISFNEYVIESVAERLRREEDREWAEAYDRLGEDQEMSDVEYAIPAIVEVITKHDR